MFREVESKLSFGKATDLIKTNNGFFMRLPQWKDDVGIYVQRYNKNYEMTAPYFYVASRFGTVPWIPTMIEMFSDEWVIAE